MAMGRPKAEIPREKAITVRLTNFEFEKISRLAEKLKISKTETIVRAINLLETHKPIKYVNLKERRKKHREEMIKKGLTFYADDKDDDD